VQAFAAVFSALAIVFAIAPFGSTRHRRGDLRAAAVERDDALPLILALLVDRSSRLVDDEELVRARAPEKAMLAVRPDDLDLGRNVCGAEAEVRLDRILRDVVVSGAKLAHLPPTARGHVDARADRRSVGRTTA
jgi:hypothetical protein